MCIRVLDKSGSTDQVEASPYHHGNLKISLIEAYLELLETLPASKISLRKIASHIGVAATAVYNHFKKKDELITAVRVRLLDIFASDIRDRMVEVKEPEDKIRQLGIIYFQFSRDYPQYFEILFSDIIPEEFVTEELLSAGMRAEEPVRNAVSCLLEKHGLPKDKFHQGVGSFACWSLAHGVTTLAANRINQAACKSERWPEEIMLADDESIQKTFDSLSRIMVSGILAMAKSED